MPSQQADGPARPAGENVYDLSHFGPVKTAVEADRTLEKAARTVLAAGGGVIVIPTSAPSDWQPENRFQDMIRTPPPPAPANKGWATGPGLTILDARKPSVYLPPVTGLRIERTFDLRPGDSSPHWQYHPAVRRNNHLVNGVGNYRGTLAVAVAAGKDRKFFVETLQGLYPGQHLRSSGARGQGDETLLVEGLGYDRERKLPFFVADAAADLAAGTELEGSRPVTTLRTTTRAQNELQTFDVFNRRWHYSQGDTYQYDGYLAYMGNESSASPEPRADADGVRRGSSAILSATSRSETNVFRGRVEAIHPARNEVKYAGGRNAHTLGTGRPLINMNPKKWVTAGHAYIIQPGGALLNWGGSLRSQDAPWSADLVGRFFAVDDPSEYVPGSDKVRRWWQITGFDEKAGVKSLNVRRYWWGAKNQSVGISRLYGANWSTDDKNFKPLKYIIAPGSYVYDVADGAGRDERASAGGGTRTIKVAPYHDQGTAFDFAAGDDLEQAIGPDPFMPIPFRAWLFDKVPGAFPAPALDLSNSSPVTRSSAIAVGGAAPIGSVLLAGPGSTVGTVLDVMADAESLFVFRQKNGNRQGISWDGAQAVRTLGVDPASGIFSFNGDVSLAGEGMTGLRSLSGRPGSAATANLRGIGAPVPAGARKVAIAFPTPEADDQYAVTVQPSWLTDRAVTAQDKTGFTVTFSAAAPVNARLNWLIVR